MLISAFSLSDEGLNVIKSESGFLFVFNDSQESFLVEIKGKKFIDVEPEELIFSIDGQIVQFTVVPLKEFFEENLNSDTLQQHFDYEFDFIKKNFKVSAKPIIQRSKFGRKVYYWELDRDLSHSDTSSETIVRQLFATTNIDSFVIMISSPITRSNDYKQCRKKIVEALKNIKFQKGKYDLEALRDSLMKK